MRKQCCSPLTDTVIMVAPEQFGFNSETAETNSFQHQPDEAQDSLGRLRDAACGEFQHVVEILTSHQIRVLVLPGRKDVVTPDAVFPNNWFSHHREDTLVLYPMLAPNRRAERQPSLLRDLLQSIGCHPVILDLSSREQDGLILEGTGSLVLDRAQKVAFAMASSRTHQVVVDEWCHRLGYRACFFHAYDKLSRPIYHTNVFMSIGDGFAVASLDAIPERASFENTLRELGKEIIQLSQEQLYSFCGNILHLRSQDGRQKIMLSQTSMSAFTREQREQREQLEQYGDLVPVAIPTIERIGGGGVRCMLAEVFPPNREQDDSL